MTKKFEPRPPTVFTPFFRRFTNQREIEKTEVYQLHARVSDAWKKSRWAEPGALEMFAEVVQGALGEHASLPAEDSKLRETLFAAVCGSLALERHIFTCPDLPPVLSIKEQIDVRDFLHMQQRFLADEGRQLVLLHDTLLQAFLPLVQALPNTDGTTTLTTPLVDRLPNTPALIEHLFAVMASKELMEAGLFVDLFNRYHRNACTFSGLPIDKDAHKLIHPTKANLAPQQIVETYLAHTPLLQLFQTQVPFAIPDKAWSSHGVILAPPGHGKTQLLGALIHGFLEDTENGMCVLDPHGDLFNILGQRVHPDRFIVLDPDSRPPPLNFLDFGSSTPAETLQTFAYLMSSLSGGLSDKQAAIVPYLLKLLQKIPGASLETLRTIVDEKVKAPDRSQFASAIKTLPPIDQGFFANQFYSTRMQETKDAIGWKLYSALSSDAFRAMFSASRNSFDADAAMRERKIVLVKGARSALGDEGMSVFLQFIVSQFFSAALRRHRIPPQERELFLLFADEAHHIFNSQTSNILTECRKYGLGFMAATQVVQQIPDDVKAAIYGATAIKIAGPVSHSDAQVLAREMYTTGEFIRSMKAVERSHADFAFYVAGMTDRAVRVCVPYGTLERMEKQKAAPFEPPPQTTAEAVGIVKDHPSKIIPPTENEDDDAFYSSPMKGV